MLFVKPGPSMKEWTFIGVDYRSRSLSSVAHDKLAGSVFRRGPMQDARIRLDIGKLMTLVI